MRKSLLKSLVAVAVVGATMAITSVAAMAADSVEAFVTGDKDSSVTAVTEYSQDTDVISVKSTANQILTVKASDTNYKVSAAETQSVARALRTDASSKKGIQVEYYNPTTESNASNFRPALDVQATTAGTLTVYFYVNSTDKDVAVIETTNNGLVYVKGEQSSEKKAMNYDVDIKANTLYQIGGLGGNQDVIGVIFTPSEAAAPEIVNGVTDGKLAVVNANDVYYAVALVSATSAASKPSFQVSSDATQTFDTVYGSVELGGTTYTAADLGGGEKDYVYGFEVTVNGAPSSLAAVQDKVGSVQF